MKKIVLVLLWWGCCCSQEALAPFASGGFKSNPAKLADPSVFVSCESLGGVDVFGCGGGGEFSVFRQRVYFYSLYQEMDSLYREVYSELGFAYSWKYLIVGGAYGYSVEWSPGIAKWSRSRYKGGITVPLDEFYLEATMEGWLSGFEKTWSGALGGGVQLGRLGSAYGQWDGSSLVLGNRVSWKLFTLETSYQFPNFGVGFRLSLSLGRWKPFGAYGFSQGKYRWFLLGCARKGS